MTTSEITRLTEKQWQESVDSLSLHSFFVSPLWGRMLADAGLGYTCRAISITTHGLTLLLPSGDSRRFGLIARESMPFGTYGGPLIIRREQGADERAAAHEVSRRFRSDPRLAFIAVTPGIHPHLALEELSAHHETDVVDLRPGVDHLWSGLDVRDQVRRAERAGVEVRFDNSESAFRAYYEMLTVSARRWGIGEYGKPWSLFHAISKHATSDGVRLWLANVDGTPAAGALCFYGRGEVFWWSGAMHQEFARVRPNNLIQWRIIEDATARGFSDYNMGASGDLAGVQHFKRQFGAVPRRYPSYVIRGTLWNAGRTIARLPDRLSGGR